MSLSLPTTQETNDLIIAQLELSLNQTIPLLPKSFLRVLAKSLSGVFTLLYKYAGFIHLQSFVKFASAKPVTVNGKTFVPLEEWGVLVGAGKPKRATQAELIIDITVESQVGSLPAGTQLIGPNGVTYITIGITDLNAATVQATIRAASDQAGGSGAGTIGNLLPGDVVSFANTLANVARDTVVVSQAVTGAQAENTEAYRRRVMDRFQKRPQGGAYVDYGLWGEEVEGIVNIYPYTGTPGQVSIYVEATPESSGDPDGIPTQTQLDAVKASIETDDNGLASRRPVGSLVNTIAISRVGFDVTVTGLFASNLSQVQADITTAIQEYFWGREPYIVGFDVSPRSDRIIPSAVGGIVDDIASAAGGYFTSVTVKHLGVQVSLHWLQEGEKAKAATVTFN